ncbi:hypothetical protein QJS04_geneDACA000143 [Acorus gramineus]|uniref:Uncharacterized protein n=1 Tax=Acorus gramineus TaxID=55184 RepID=A0AAV9APL5_ACOGR|nr:hypothetical protein QJS04_geneDACA000143 [Acorus gramineus]
MTTSGQCEVSVTKLSYFDIVFSHGVWYMQAVLSENDIPSIPLKIGPTIEGPSAQEPPSPALP